MADVVLPYVLYGIRMIELIMFVVVFGWMIHRDRPVSWRIILGLLIVLDILALFAIGVYTDEIF